MDNIDNVFQSLGLILIVINAILYTKSYISSKNHVALLFLFLYLTICAIIMIVSSVLAYNELNNIYLAHIYFVFQFILLSLFYHSLFNSRQKKIVTIILVSVVTILVIQYFNNPDLIYKFNLFEIFITSFPLVVYSIVHLYNSLSKQGEYMYINAGVLIYLTSSTLIFILGNYLHSVLDKDTSIYIWFINKVLYVIYLLLILVEWKKSILPLKRKL
ncbi:hypothetical protein A9Q86_14665 [Flavobacteriales bacterium 33_180_T64]|nr:hypothetical protein A9Q86_14665 [Flavobacteriales bacterium 33_180_T64]